MGGRQGQSQYITIIIFASYVDIHRSDNFYRNLL